MPSIYLFVKYLIIVSYAEYNNELSGGWWIWATYMLAFYLAVAVIFGKVVQHLDNDEILDRTL